MGGRPTEFLLILGGAADQLPLLRTAREMGIGVACVDGNPAAPGLALADYSAPISFTDHSAVVEWIRSLLSSSVAISGVSSMGTDHPECLTAIGSAFGWSVPTPITGTLARDKYEMMRAWRDAGVPVPRFEVVHSAVDVLRLWRSWDCDGIVIKPTLCSGSRGVSILIDRIANDVEAAFFRAASQSGHVLVEEHLPGLQLSTESILCGWHRMVAIGDRNYRDAEGWLPQPMENGGWLPCSLHPRQVDEVERVVEAAARALGIVRGPAKGDVAWVPGRGPVMIEMGARLSGGDLVTLAGLSTGVDYVSAAIEIALGRVPDIERLVPTRSRVVANRYLFSPPGRLEAARGFDEVASWPGVKKLELWCKPGDQLDPIAHHGQRRGVFIVEGATRDEVQTVISAAYERLQLAIDGRWLKCHPGSRRQWTR